MTRSQLCATVTATTMAELLQRREAVHGADLVELRLDGVRDIDVAAALAGRRLPVIVTCRAAWQGGRFDGAEEVRTAILERAWDLGAEFVDIEDGAAADLLRRASGRRLVRSFHDFDGGVAEAPDRLRHLLASGAEVAKLAVTATRLADLGPLAALGRAAAGRTVILAMGEAGVASRVLAARMGARWTYAGEAVAPGQLSLARMRDEFRVPAITAATRVFGVLGRPVGHSLSPAMHNAALADAGLDAVYLPLAAESFDDFAAFADAFAVEGVSVTAPFKLEARHAATVSDVRTATIGAVNTLRRSSGGWEGLNTDVDGFMAPLAGRDLRGRRAAVLGAGGAARSVVVALAAAGAAVTVHARRPEAARTLAAATGAAAGVWPPAEDAWEVLVNTTPVGTAPDRAAAPLRFSGRLDGRLVYDLVYNPADTALLRQAGALGAECLGGLPMLAAQAAAQFAWWTGLTPPDGLMARAASARLADGVSVPAVIAS
jgi:3-dehydroquinate dehydratase / shikimate dehydrogenase